VAASAADARQDRWNFNVLLAQGVAKNVGYELSSEKLVLPYIYTTLGGPALFAGLLIPAVEFSKVVAQVAGATLIKLARVTKWYLAGATIVTAFALGLVSLAAADIPPDWLVGFFVAVAAMR
jgi:hypothetical protein